MAIHRICASGSAFGFLFAALGVTAVPANNVTDAAASAPQATPADVVVIGAKIYTVDSQRTVTEALAIRDGRIAFVGTTVAAKKWIGPKSQVVDLGGRLVLPGLIDAHIHPLDIVDLDVCDLNSRALSLRELSVFVAGCLVRYHVEPGGRLVVHQWNYTSGNQADSHLPTLRAALDAVSTKVEVQLLGDDGHHGAFNSLALSHARNAADHVIGLSKASLHGDFAEYRSYVGVDSNGEPNGTVNEDARYLINPHSMVYTELAAVEKAPERVPRRLNSVGITGIMDAMAEPAGLPVYDQLIAENKLTVRVRLAQFYDPSHTRTASGQVDYEGIIKRAEQVRARYAGNPLLHADIIKLFADGVLEGNPLAIPPTLPNAPVLTPYLQPIFNVDAKGQVTVTGYVDTASPDCADVRAHPEQYEAPTRIAAFMDRHHYHPAQCTISSGQLQHVKPVIMEYVKRCHQAGFNMHIHAISDMAVRTALDAIEAARASDGNAHTRDALAHVQLAAPGDIARIGHDRVYVAFTYSWMDVDPDYDVTVIPFIQKVTGSGYAALHQANSYYETSAYPARAVMDAGGILAAGSDAPVGGRDPQPFVNMSRAVTRAIPGKPALSPAQRISIEDAINAYTINGARMLDLDKDAGSIEIGKSADFIVLDRDILRLAAQGHPERIEESRVIATWFQGRKVFGAPEANRKPH